MFLDGIHVSCPPACQIMRMTFTASLTEARDLRLNLHENTIRSIEDSGEKSHFICGGLSQEVSGKNFGMLSRAHSCDILVLCGYYC